MSNPLTLVVIGTSLLALATLIGAGLLLVLRSSLPILEGRQTVTGLKEPVTIVRDENAVPHVFAYCQPDAYFAVGFLHAQDRLWQMEFARRAGAGRLAEILGSAALDADRLTRTLGLYRAAQASLNHLSPETRAALSAYAAGVNAWISARQGALPPEFVFLRHEPEPWREEDSLVVQKLMALRLGRNREAELLRARIAEALSDRGLGDSFLHALWPEPDANEPVSIMSPVTEARSATSPAWHTCPPLVPIASGAKLEGIAGAPGGGSNGWVIHGSKTDTGKPILANDPHLIFDAPVLWYLARIETPRFRVTGATLPGLPFTMLGHNGGIAWGITNGGADVEDLYAEKICADDASRYLSPEGPLSFVSRVETIGVRGAAAVVITIRETRHGPVVSDAWGAGGVPTASGDIAFSTPALRPDDRSVEALLVMNWASNWEEFSAVDRLLTAPHLNLLFASTDGDIGLLSAGTIPIRRAGNGLFIAPGDDAAHDWLGFIPPGELPRAFNPPSGRIVNANNQIADRGYRYSLSAETELPFRAERILEVLDDAEVHTLPSSQALQLDVLSIPARRLVPVLLRATPTTDRDRRAMELLSLWDFRMERDRPEPLIFTAWVRVLLLKILRENIGAELADDYLAANFDPSLLFLEKALSGTAAPRREALVHEALRKAMDELAKKLGPNVDDWTWGAEHRATFPHRIFSRVPFLGKWADLSVASPGGDHTVNVGQVVSRAGAPFCHGDGAGFRAVYDLSHLDNSRFIIATGQSGNLLSRHYADQMIRWRDGQYITIAGSREDLERSGLGALTLVPVTASNSL